MKNIMLDLETMGLGPNAAIIAIGAVEFDLEKGKLGRWFYEVVDLESSVQLGGTIDPSTVLWWMRQSDEARNQFTYQGAPLTKALADFKNFFLEAGDNCLTRLWGNGSDFDNMVLRSAYVNSGLKAPWLYGNNRCYRTVCSLVPGIKLVRKGTHHNALEDARSQAEHLLTVYASMENVE